MAKRLESASEPMRERIYGHLGDNGETLGIGLRRKIAKIFLKRHALETEQLHGGIEKALNTVGDGISSVDAFFHTTDMPKKKRTRATKEALSKRRRTRNA